jgi:pSer/pThr/pTyr-binding forkhead associated (FHA) protein
MIVCRHCGWDNPAEAAFCTNCGRGLGRSRPGGDAGIGESTPSAAVRRFRSLEAARPVLLEAEEPLPPLRAPPGPSPREAQATLIDFSLQAVLAELRANQSPPPADDDPLAGPALDEAPASDDEAPASDDEAPASDDEAPASDDEAPASDDEAPAPLDEADDGGSAIVGLGEAALAFAREASGGPPTLNEEPRAPAASVALLAPPVPLVAALVTLDEEVVEDDLGSSADGIEDEQAAAEEAEPPDFDDALEIPGDSVDEEADRLFNDTGDYDSVDLEPEAGPAEAAPEPADEADQAPAAELPLREEADFDAEEISASDLDEGAGGEATMLDSGEFEAVDAPSRPLPPPLPALVARYVLRPLSNNVAASRLVPVGDQPVVIGRTEADVELGDDRYLSPRHAAFLADEKGLYVEDLASLNGVWLRVRKDALLRDGDSFMVGRQVLRVERIRARAGGETPDGTRRLGVPRPVDGARLVQLGDDGEDRDVYHVSAEGCRLGRHIADVVFTDDGFMSGTHALVVPRGEGFLIRDLSSRNGTWIRITGRRQLAVGDAVMLGQTVWRVGQPVS